MAFEPRLLVLQRVGLVCLFSFFICRDVVRFPIEDAVYSEPVYLLSDQG